MNNRRKKGWEKDNGKSVEQAIYDGNNRIVDYTAQVKALNEEKSRIPDQTDAIDRQIDALVNGESSGLSKGLTTAQAQQVGQLALQKEQDAIAHEADMQKVELQKAQTEAQTEAEKAKGMNPTLKWGLIIGGSVLAIIGIYFLMKHKKALALQNQAS